MKLQVRPSVLNSLAPQLPRQLPLQPFLSQRCAYATQQSNSSSSSATKRRSVTPFNDDGQVPWSELSVGGKAARATQQSFNFGLVVVGIALTGGVGYFLYQDVFSPDSKTAYFNRAVDRLKKDPECLALLGDPKKITAYGEETMNKWRRARPIASTHTTDPKGSEHIVLHFYVEGPRNHGTVNVHLIKRAGTSDFVYKYLFLDVPGHSRIYLENADASLSQDSKKFKLFGVNWR